MDANAFYRGLLGVNDEPSGLGLLDPTDVQRRNAINQGLLAMGAQIANASGAQRLPVSTAQVISSGMLAGNQGYNTGLKTIMDQQAENLKTNALLQNYQRQNMLMDLAQKMVGGYGQTPQPAAQAPSSSQRPTFSTSNGAPGTNLVPALGPVGVVPQPGLLPQPQQPNTGLLFDPGNPQAPGAMVGGLLAAIKGDPGAWLTANKQLYPDAENVRPSGAVIRYIPGRGYVTMYVAPSTEGVATAVGPNGEMGQYNIPGSLESRAKQAAPPGSYFNDQVGAFTRIPGYNDIVADNTRLIEAAKAPYAFVDKYNPVTKQMEKVPLSSVTPPATAPSPTYQAPPSPQPQPVAPPLPQAPIVRPMPPAPQITGRNITGSQGGFPMVGRDQVISARGLSGFPAGPSLSETTEQKGIGEANAGVYKNVLAQGAAAHDTMNSVALLDSLYKDGLNTGDYTPFKTKAASLIKSAGMDPGSFLLADPKNATTYEKATIQMGFQFARSNLPGQRITQQEVSTALKANPNVRNPNDTNQLLQAVIYGAAAYKDNMQNVIQMYMDQNRGSVQGFQQWYNQHYNVMDFYRGAYKDGVWVQPPQKPAEGGYYNLPNVGWAKYLGNGKWQPR